MANTSNELLVTEHVATSVATDEHSIILLNPQSLNQSAAAAAADDDDDDADAAAAAAAAGAGADDAAPAAAAGAGADDAAPTSTFSSRVVTFFRESAKNRNVQFGTAAVVGAAVGFGLSYVPGVTPLVVDLLGKAAAAMIPPVAALVIVGALVGVLLALAIEFAYDKYHANNTSKISA